MAKLEGVKTLDMVNGEITKVAYGGAEYVKTESPVQEGDIFLLTEGHSVIGGDTGAFYLTVKDWDGDIVIPTKYVGLATTVQKKGDGIAFRKVSAPQPSLEDRVSTNEMDIAALKSDVAALKGEAKTEYVRIAKSEAKAGDFVKFDEAPFEYLTAGKFYEIEFVDDCGDPIIYDDEGDDFDTHGEVFEVYRKVSAAEPKPERLKVGDYAKVVGNESGHYVEIDEIVLIKRDDKDFAPFHCEKLNGDAAGIFYEDELVHATDEEVAEAKDAADRAKFKKGAKVRLKSGGGVYPLLGFENGKVYTVVDNDFLWGITEKKIQIEHDRGRGWAGVAQLELLSEEDAAEIEKWAAIGREVGEYKVGDIVVYDDPTWFGNSGIGEVIGYGDQGGLLVEAVGYEGLEASYYIKPNRLKLVAPVEARFDRKGDE
ncbi:hypothetical protein [Bacillus paralicheniformis]|uniref:hypothetical protein n=1 Tax=Bacillus paralicheniformis TaxID=1648923 RepID=UPI003F7B22FD